jgi:hypothetical protein
VSANVIYCEEAAYMDRALFDEVLVPLMEVQNTAMICISTPLGTTNFYTALTQIVDDKGQPIFNVQKIGHSMRPAWKPIETYAKAKAIFGTNVAMRKRELDGEVTDGEGAYNKKLLDRMFNKPPFAEPHTVAGKVVYVAVDPNGGANLTNTAGSDTAIVSFFIHQGCYVVSVLFSNFAFAICVFQFGCGKSGVARCASMMPGNIGGRRNT